MSENSIIPQNSFSLIDFSRPVPRIILAMAVIGLICALVFYRPYRLASGWQRRLLPADALALGSQQLQSFGLDTQQGLITTLPFDDQALSLFVRDQVGVHQGHKLLTTTIPASFWEIVLRGEDDHITIFESTTAFASRAEGADRLQDEHEIHHALLRIDEQGRWFQFYHHLETNETKDRISEAEAFALAQGWLKQHPLILPEHNRSFDLLQAGTPQIQSKQNTYSFTWSLPVLIEGLSRQVTIEITQGQTSYCGIEYHIPDDYPKPYQGLWRFTLAIRLIIIILGVIAILFLLIKQLRRDAIDFHFSFTYAAIFTFPLIAFFIATIPAQMNEGILLVFKDNFYLLASATFLWLALLLLLTPIIALTDSLVRQLWPEKLATFDAMIRGRWHVNVIGQAIFNGLGWGLASLGVTTISNVLLVRWGGYGHGSLLATSLNSSVAVVWATLGSLGLAVIFSYVLLIITTLVHVRVKDEYFLPIVAGGIWLILLATTGGRYSSLANFGLFGIINTALSLYILLKYDFLTLLAQNFALLIGASAAYLIHAAHPTYQINGWLTLAILGAVCYYSWQLSQYRLGLIGPEFIPEYINKLHSRERIEQDIEIARQLQYQFLPQQVPKLAHLDIATFCHPAHEVGGDYYDFIELGPHRLGLVIADVSGKGIPAAFYMTMIKGIIQSRAFEPVSPKDLLKQINWVVYKNTGSNTFITLFYAIIDTEQATLVYSNAGHNPPLLISATGKVVELDKGGIVLGILPSPEYQQEMVTLQSGDQVLLYTDGVIETTDVMGTEFGTERLANIVQHKPAKPAKQVLTNITKSLETFAAGAPQADDITMILVGFTKDEKIDNRD